MFLRGLAVIFLGLCGTLYAEDIPAGRYDRSKEVSKSLHLLNFSFGPAKFLREQGDIAYFLKISDEFDITDKASALITWNFVFDEGSNAFIDLSLGGRYFFGSEDMSAFAGGNLGLGTVHTDLQDHFGFTFGGEVGLQFFRKSDVHFDISLNYKGHFKYNPNILGVTVGISFPVRSIF
jgi:hypothetical protein